MVEQGSDQTNNTRYSRYYALVMNLDLNKNHTLKNDQLAIMYENTTCLRWPYSVWYAGEASHSGAHYMEWEDHWSRSSISIINIGVFWTVWSQHVCVCLSVYFYVWSVSSLKQTCPPTPPSPHSCSTEEQMKADMCDWESAHLFPHAAHSEWWRWRMI